MGIKNIGNLKIVISSENIAFSHLVGLFFYKIWPNAPKLLFFLVAILFELFDTPCSIKLSRNLSN